MKTKLEPGFKKMDGTVIKPDTLPKFYLTVPRTIKLRSFPVEFFRVTVL